MAGQRSNQLNYVPTCLINEMQNRQYLFSFAGIASCAPTVLGCSMTRNSRRNRLTSFKSGATRLAG